MENPLHSMHAPLHSALLRKPYAGGIVYVGALDQEHDPYCWTQGYGDYRLKTPLNHDTLFPIASLTKQFTSMALLIALWEESHHKTDQLDDLLKKPLAYFIPKFPSDHPHWAHEVTLHHILTHISGVENYTDFDEHVRLYNLSHTRERMQAHVWGMKRHSPSAGSFSYCNTGYYIVAEVIEALTGKDTGTWMHDVIFSPLGMTRTFLPHASSFKKWAKHHGVSNVALGYKFNVFGKMFKRVPIRNDEYPPFEGCYTDGGILSTINDLLAWSFELFVKREVFPVPLIDRLLTPHVNVPRPIHTHEFYGYGMGMVNVGQPHMRFSHTGRIMGYETLLAYYPGIDLVVVQLLNVMADYRARIKLLKKVRTQIKQRGMHDTNKIEIALQKHMHHTYTHVEQRYAALNTELLPCIEGLLKGTCHQT